MPFDRAASDELGPDLLVHLAPAGLYDDDECDDEEDIDCEQCDGSGRVLRGEGLGMKPSLHCDDGGDDGDQTEDCGACCGFGILNW